MDVISDFAYPLPAVVIAEMMGVPPDRPRPVQGLVRRPDGAGVRGAGRGRNVANAPRAACWSCRSIWATLVRRFRAAPQENLIATLHSGAGGRRHAHRRRDRGHLHTAAFRRARDHHQPHRQRPAAPCWHNPDQLERLRSHARRPTTCGRPPRRSCASTARPRCRSAWLPTTSTRAGSLIRRHDMVYLVQAAANRDPDVFAEPKPIRPGTQPHRACGLRFRVALLPRRRGGPPRRDPSPSTPSSGGCPICAPVPSRPSGIPP